MSKHRPGVHEDFLIKHKLKLVGLTSSNADNIFKDIDVLVGMDSVNIGTEENFIKLAYDASFRNIDEILTIIRRHGADVSDDWWNHFKLNWDRGVDQNIKDNSRLEPHCCNKIPPDYHKNK